MNEWRNDCSFWVRFLFYPCHVITSLFFRFLLFVKSVAIFRLFFGDFSLLFISKCCFSYGKITYCFGIIREMKMPQNNTKIVALLGTVWEIQGCYVFTNNSNLSERCTEKLITFLNYYQYSERKRRNENDINRIRDFSLFRKFP